MSRLFVNITRENCIITSLSLALKRTRAILFHAISQSKYSSYLPCFVFQTQKLNIPYKVMFFLLHGISNFLWASSFTLALF